MRKAKPKAKVVISVVGGVVESVLTSDPSIEVILCDWDCDGESPLEDDIVEIDDGVCAQPLLVRVVEYPTESLANVSVTDVGAALQKAGLAW